MKKSILTASIVLAAIITLSSITTKEVRNSGVRITYTVPIKPRATALIEGDEVYAYLKRGYQIQNAWYDHSTYKNQFVVVKY
jgi:hypothetical protein